MVAPIVRAGLYGRVPRGIIRIVRSEAKPQQQRQRNQTNCNDFVDARVALRGLDFYFGGYSSHKFQSCVKFRSALPPARSGSSPTLNETVAYAARRHSRYSLMKSSMSPSSTESTSPRSSFVRASFTKR